MSRYQGGIITKSPATPTGPTTAGRAPGMWSLTDAAYWTKQGLWPNANIQAPDASFPYVSLLLSTTSLGNANNNLFVDSSGAFNPISRNGNTTQGSATPYSANWSVYSDNSGDYLTTGSGSSAFAFGTGNFTIEGWFYSDVSTATWKPMISVGAASQGQLIRINQGIFTTGNWGMLYPNDAGNSDVYFNTGAAFPLNQWVHVALVRSGTTLTLYQNGVNVLQKTVGFNFTNTTGVAIGYGQYPADGVFGGYMSNIRIVKGTAVYTANFTPPTSALTAISGTSLLTCQSNRFRDASSNNFTITPAGNIRVTDFAPFSPAYPGITYNQSDITNWSGWFNGGTDRVQVPVTSNMYLGTTYTIEAWAYYNSTSYGARPIFSQMEPFQGGFAGLTLTLNTSGNLVAEYRPVTSGAVTTITGPTVTPYTWFHIALVSDSSSAKLYVNGTQVGSTTTFGDYPSAKTNTVAVGSWGSGWNDSGIPAAAWIGYISNLRVVKGTAVYTSNFTPPTTPLTSISGTVLLTCQNAAFTDNSTVNNILTPVSNATVTGNSPFNPVGYWSNYFDGTGDYLETPSSSAAGLTGNWTVEAWVYPTSFASVGALFDCRSGGTGFAIYYNLTGFSGGAGAMGYATNSALVANSSAVINLNAWNHIAVVRSANTVTGYANGSSVFTYTETRTNATTTTYQIGIPSAIPFGYFSNVRVVRGTAIYSGSTITVPTAPLTAITNTSLLTCQNGRFIDNSTNAFAITVNGNTAVQSFNPFYTSTIASNGGSMYFDGTGDYLRGANSPAFAFGTGNFTVEMWAYFMDPTATNRPLFDNGATSSTGRLLIRQGNDAGTANVVNAFVSGTTVSSPTIQFYSWTHVAVVRNSGTVTIYINGVGGTGVTATADLSQNACLLGAFYDQLAWNFTGYMSNVRITKGTAVYTAAFTPPTAPLTPSANTTLLVNGMNAGAYDATAINDMETVGNAQVSTVQSKFGGSSIYVPSGGGCALIPNSQPLTLGTGNWTIEFWGYTDASGTKVYMDLLNVANTVIYGEMYSIGTTLYWYRDGSNFITGTGALTANTWQHIAVAKSGTSTKLFVNGTQVGSTLTDSFDYASARWEIGGRSNLTLPIVGYIDDLRITKGVARYTANFTPPTQAFPPY